MGRPSSREHILEAAEAVVTEVGSNRLTLEAVAERAGVSKGGLLYHFPSKEALLASMVQRLIDDYRSRQADTLESLPSSPDRHVRAHIMTKFPAEGCADANRCRRIASAMLAAAAADRKLLDPIREHIASVVRSLASQDGRVDPERLVVLLAAEGLGFWELLDVSPLTAEEKASTVERLLAMSGGDVIARAD